MASIARNALRRGYATASSVKPPVQLNSLPGTYASSAYVAAAKQGKKELDQLAEDVTAFSKSLRDNAELKAKIDNPTLSARERTSVLKQVVPEGSSPILFNLLNVLSENGRLGSAPRVFEDFEKLMSAHRGELLVTVTSAEPLDNKSMNRLEKALKGSQVGQDKSLKFVNRVNPSVQGGLLVDLGDKTIDATAATRVNRFNQALAEGI